MTSRNNCPFCNSQKVKSELPGEFHGELPCECDRCIYENDSSFAVLCPQQYTVGHTLVIFNQHKFDITDEIDKDKFCDFTKAIKLVAKQLKDKAQDHRRKSPEKIYTCILSDGIEHLHAHLIPRYPFTKRDETAYRKTFIPRDGVIKVGEKIKGSELGGFWYVALREREWKNSEFAEKPIGERANILEELAKKLQVRS